jgi:transcriptional regulator GlxA family with amidase domain
MNVVAARGLVPHADVMRRIVVLAFPGVQSLDVAGPVEVVAAAGDYEVQVVAPAAGRVAAPSGLELYAERALAEVEGPLDTLLIAGGEGTPAVMTDADLLATVRGLAPTSRRLASVCSGAFVLAEAGLLDGRRATTHWGSCDLLARMYPAVTVEPDSIYVRDGDVWTSAGVTAGIDLALAMVEDDLGRELALEVARRLVVFHKRPGGQSQFSAQLAGQFADREPLRELQGWIADHVDEDLGVERLAAEVAMSERNFSRAFHREVGMTPARFVERTRVDAARRHLEESTASIDDVAIRCGFGTAETMRRTFLRVLGVTPSDYRNRFRTPVHQLQPFQRQEESA